MWSPCCGQKQPSFRGSLPGFRGATAAKGDLCSGSSSRLSDYAQVTANCLGKVPGTYWDIRCQKVLFLIVDWDSFCLSNPPYF